MLVNIIGTLIQVFGTAAWDIYKGRREAAKTLNDRTPRLVFLMNNGTPEGRPLARLDIHQQCESVRCANGHTYALHEFYCPDGVDTKVVYDEVTTRSETRATLVDALDGFRKDDNAVRSVREDTSYLPRTQTTERRRFGCPACKTSVYSFINPEAGEYVPCAASYPDGAIQAHWYHRSIGVCVVCDAAAFAAFKTRWHAANEAAGVVAPALLGGNRQPSRAARSRDLLDDLPAPLANRMRFFFRTPRQDNPIAEMSVVESAKKIREQLSAAGHGDAVRCWEDSITEACREEGLDPVLGLCINHRWYLMDLAKGRTSPPDYETDCMTTENMAAALLYPTTLPAGATPLSRHGAVRVGPLAENNGGIWRITDTGRQYLQSCRDRQAREGWFIREDFSALGQAQPGDAVRRGGVRSGVGTETDEDATDDDTVCSRFGYLQDNNSKDMPIKIRRRLEKSVRAHMWNKSGYQISADTWRLAESVAKFYGVQQGAAVGDAESKFRAWEEALTKACQADGIPVLK